MTTKDPNDDYKKKSKEIRANFEQKEKDLLSKLDYHQQFGYRNHVNQIKKVDKDTLLVLYQELLLTLKCQENEIRKSFLKGLI